MGARPALERADLRALQALLRRAPVSFRWYGWWKARLDPLYALLLAEIEDGSSVADLGAGIGLAAALLARRLPSAHVRAVECDERKVRAARALLAGVPRVMVEQADVRDLPLGEPDAVILADVLHYLAPHEQRALLERCAGALRPRGLLLIRETDRRRDRLRAAERIERLAMRLGWNRGAGVRAWALDEMAAFLRGLGFRVETRPAGRGPFSANTLLVCRKG